MLKFIIDILNLDFFKNDFNFIKLKKTFANLLKYKYKNNLSYLKMLLNIIIILKKLKVLF